MQFSDTSNKTGIVEDIDFLCGTDATSYPLVDKARNVNRHYYKVVADIHRTAGRNQYDDSNLASLPKTDLTMVEGTHEVALAETNFLIHAVEVKDLAGNWVRIQEFDLAEKYRSVSSFNTSSGFPRFYDVLGSYLYLEPAPTAASVTLSSGLRVWVGREVDAFTAADTTQEPGFAEPFHRILSLGASYDYLIVNGPKEKADQILAQYETLREELRTFYSNKNRDSRNKIRPIHSTQQYM